MFGRAWVFVAHESEIARPGDYVVRRLLDDSFIVIRDERGGNASHFWCPYHGCSYRNDGGIAGLPFRQ